VKTSTNILSRKSNPNQLALLVIDVQQGLFKKSTPIYKAEELLMAINELVDSAHRANVPVFYVQHSNQKDLLYGSEEWQIHPGLHPLPQDCLISKLHGNAFEVTTLEEELIARNISSVVVAGLVTHGCVRATCIGAKELGYTVTLVADGHSNYNKDAARLIEEWNLKLSAGGVEVKPASQIKFELIE
jgi:nicotinamidase-related amidase